MTDRDKIKQVINRAKELIEAGWRQGKLREVHEDGTLSYCIVGAVCEAYDEIYGDGKNYSALRGACSSICQNIDGRRVVSFWVTMAQFNDAPGRTKAEVVQLLRSVVEGI